MILSEYRRKRDLGLTNEPAGAEPERLSGPTTRGAFVIHQHDATRMHYDLRLEMAGVLASFAIPRGPTLDPDARHLAVNTEDHPIEYLDFEAVIPAGTYGAGPMILWDRGVVRYLEPAEDGIRKGKLDFELEGMKTRGRFALVRIKSRGDGRSRASRGGATGGSAGELSGHEGKEWLLIKKRDRYASKDRDLIATSPRSILSGLTIEELADAPRIAREVEARAAELGAPVGHVDGRAVAPMLCSTDGMRPSQKGWLYELKLDGVRIIADKDGDRASLHYRTTRDTTLSYGEVARAVRALAVPRVVLDGEIVAFDERGRPNFQRLGARIHAQRGMDVRRAMLDVPVVFLVFDLLAVGERDLRGLPLIKRKELLSALVRGSGVLRVLDHIEDDGAPLLAFCRDNQLEGIVAKRADSPYREGGTRTGEWLKMKCERDDEFVIVGFTRGERDAIGALDLASYEGDELVYRGKVGSGLDAREIATLLEKLEPLGIKEWLVRGKPVPAKRGRTFVRPELCVSVRFLGFSEDGQVRHPVYRGLRDDKTPRQCVAAPTAKAVVEEVAEEAVPERAVDVAPEPSAPPRKRAAITNRNKVLWPEAGFTKGDLVNYYEAIAPAILPYLAERPVMLVRYPDGVHGKSFYQWNVPPSVPGWVRTIKLRSLESDGKDTEVFLVDDVDSLVFVANLGTMPIHILAARAQTLTECDFFTIDFDIKNSTFPDAVRVALTLNDLLEQIELPGFLKTSGQTGLHVFVPLGPGVAFPVAQTLADLAGRLLCRRHPDIATMERMVHKRGSRVYVDTGQTGRSRTIVAPWAVRATPEASVSVPLRWEELTPALDPKRFTLRTTPARFVEAGDPMAPMLAHRPSVPRAVERLEAIVRETSR